MVLLSDILKGSIVALGALLTLLTAPTTLHIPLRNAAVRGATRLRVLLGAAYSDRVAERLVDAGPAIPPAPPGATGAQASVKSAADVGEPVEDKASVSRGETETTEPQTSASPDVTMRGATQPPVLLGTINAEWVPDQLVDSVAIPPAPPGSTEVLASLKSAVDAVGPVEDNASVPRGETETTEPQTFVSPDEIMREATRLPVLLGAINAEWVPDHLAECAAISPALPKGMEVQASVEPAVDLVLGSMEREASVPRLGTTEVTETVEGPEPQIPASLDVSKAIGLREPASLETIEAAIGPQAAQATPQVPPTDSTSKVVVAMIQPAPSCTQPLPLPLPLHFLLPGALIVRGSLGNPARPPVNIWVIMSVIGPLVAITWGLIRCRPRNKYRRRLAVLDSSVPSVAAVDGVDKDGVDNNTGTTGLEERCEHVEAGAPIFLNFTFPSPNLHFVPVMENAPDLDGASESQSSGNPDRPLIPSVSSITIAPPTPELSENTELHSLNSQYARTNHPSDILRTTDEVAQAPECPHIDLTPPTQPTTTAMPPSPPPKKTVLPKPVTSGDSGVKFLPAPHFQFDTWVPDEVANTVVLTEAGHTDSPSVFNSWIPDAESTPYGSPIVPDIPDHAAVTPRTDYVSHPLTTIMEDTESFDTSSISSVDVEHVQGATRTATAGPSTPLEARVTLASSGARERYSGVPPNGLMISTVQISHALPAVDVDVPLAPDSEMEGALVARLPSLATELGMRSLEEGRLGLECQRNSDKEGQIRQESLSAPSLQTPYSSVLEASPQLPQPVQAMAEMGEPQSFQTTYDKRIPGSGADTAAQRSAAIHSDPQDPHFGTRYPPVEAEAQRPGDLASMLQTEPILSNVQLQPSSKTPLRQHPNIAPSVPIGKRGWSTDPEELGRSKAPKSE